MRDLRTFLDEHAPAVWRMNQAAQARFDLTALQHELDRRGQFPIIVAAGLALLVPTLLAVPLHVVALVILDRDERLIGTPRGSATSRARRDSVCDVMR